MAMTTDIENGRTRFRIGTEDILALGAVIVAVIIANGIANKTVDVVQGGAIVTALVGVAGIVQVIKAKRKKSKKK